MSASDYAGMMDVDGSDNASTVVANMDGDSYVYATDMTAPIQEKLRAFTHILLC